MGYPKEAFQPENIHPSWPACSSNYARCLCQSITKIAATDLFLVAAIHIGAAAPKRDISFCNMSILPASNAQIGGECVPVFQPSAHHE